MHAMSECLPILATAGHYNYLKSAYLYVMEMCCLDMTHPDVCEKYLKGFHVICHTNQFWAGLSSDLIIEQTLMQSLKSSGGLMHGSGMTEDMHALWTMSTSEYNSIMQELNNLNYTTSEQHKRINRIKEEARCIRPK